MRGVSLTHRMLSSFLCKEFYLHIVCWLHFFLFSFSFLFYLGSFSYTSRAGLFFIFLSGEFLLDILCWRHFYLGSISYSSRARFIFIWEVPLIHPVLTLIWSADFLLHAGFISIWGVSLPHPVLASLFYGEFLLQIPSWIYLSMGSFSYTTHPDFFFLFFFLTG